MTLPLYLRDKALFEVDEAACLWEGIEPNSLQGLFLIEYAFMTRLEGKSSSAEYDELIGLYEWGNPFISRTTEHDPMSLHIPETREKLLKPIKTQEKDFEEKVKRHNKLVKQFNKHSNLDLLLDNYSPEIIQNIAEEAILQSKDMAPVSVYSEQGLRRIAKGFLRGLDSCESIASLYPLEIEREVLIKLAGEWGEKPNFLFSTKGRKESLKQHPLSQSNVWPLLHFLALKIGLVPYTKSSVGKAQRLLKRNHIEVDDKTIRGYLRYSKNEVISASNTSINQSQYKPILLCIAVFFKSANMEGSHITELYRSMHEQDYPISKINLESCLDEALQLLKKTGS